MNFIDIIIGLLLVAAGFRGYEIGFVRQFCSLVGLLIGLLLGGQLVSVLSWHGVGAIMVLVAFVVAGVIAGEVAGMKLKIWFHESKVNIVDRLFGAGIGTIMCLVALWLSATLLSIINDPTIQISIRDSWVIRYLDKTLPPATDAIARLEKYLEDAGVPATGPSQGTEPTISSSPVTLPNIADFSNAIAAAKPSVVEIEGRSCSGIESGSGFVAADGLVITNAHVVAGMRTPFVRDTNGKHTTTVVAFDPNVDLAVLKTTNLAGKPLGIAEKTAAPQTPAALLGYPGGRSFSAKPGVISDTITAVGKDIYDTKDTRRDVLVVRADVVKGNSGGPLIAKDGVVQGVIFARSTSYKQVGYALTSQEALDILDQAQTNPSTGDSLRCGS